MNLWNSRIKSSIELLKLSAASAGSFSLSSNQVGISSAIFIMHKKLFEESENNEWLHPRAIERQNELPLYEEKKAVD